MMKIEEEAKEIAGMAEKATTYQARTDLNQQCVLTSIAISLKRIADALEAKQA